MLVRCLLMIFVKKNDLKFAVLISSSILYAARWISYRNGLFLCPLQLSNKLFQFSYFLRRRDLFGRDR